MSPPRNLKRDLFANLLNSIWVPLLSVIAVPLYIAAMGAESFGLVGLFLTLQNVVVLLDFGLSMSLNREFSRLSINSDSRNIMRDTLRSMEVIYWGIAVAIGLTVFAGAGLIAERWLRPQRLSSEVVINAIQMMAGALAVLWPLTLYSGGLMGVQRQTSLAAINIFFLTLRMLGVMPVLWFLNSSVSTFFLFQALIGTFHVLTLAAWLWKNIPSQGHRAVFRLGLLRAQISFALALTGLSAIDVVFTQADKIIISKIISLEMFGYYSIVAFVAISLNRLYMPVFRSFYPRFAQLIELRNEIGLRDLYHHGCQVIAILNFGVAIPIIVFPREVLFVWLGNSSAAAVVGSVLALLVIGSSIRGLVYLPNALQLAVGWTKLGLKTNSVAVIFFVPVLIFLTQQFGVMGAGGAWVLVNIGCTGINVWLMHRKLMLGDLSRWFRKDVIAPLVGPVAVAAIAKLVLPLQMSRPEWALALGCVVLLCVLASASGASFVRASLVERLRRKSSKD